MPNKNTFRLPLPLPETVDPHVHNAFRWVGNSLKDLNDAISKLAAKPAPEAKNTTIINGTDIGETIGTGAIVRDTAAWPKPWRKRAVLWLPTGGVNFACPYDTIQAGSGGTQSLVDATATANKSIQIRLPGTNSMTYHMNASVDNKVWSNRSSIDTVVGLVYGITNIRVWFGFADPVGWDLANFNTTVGRGNAIAFRYDASISPNLYCCVGTSAAMTAVDSGTPMSLNQWIRLRIEAVGDYANFYINENPVATIANPIAGLVYSYISIAGIAGLDTPWAIRSQWVYTETLQP